MRPISSSARPGVLDLLDHVLRQEEVEAPLAQRREVAQVELVVHERHVARVVRVARAPAVERRVLPAALAQVLAVDARVERTRLEAGAPAAVGEEVGERGGERALALERAAAGAVGGRAAVEIGERRPAADGAALHDARGAMLAAAAQGLVAPRIGRILDPVWQRPRHHRTPTS